MNLLASKPTAPTSPVAKPANAAVKLTWSAPASNGGAKIDKYAVQRATSSAGPWTVLPTTTTLGTTATSLLNGSKYYFRVRAHNSAGYGAFSAVISAVPRTVPSAPKSPVAKPANAAVKLTWSAPASNGGAKIDKYVVQRSTGTGWKSIAYPTGRGHTATNLVNGTKYSFRIRAHSAAGWGPVSATVTAIPRTVPSAPTSLKATPGDAMVELTWSAPTSNGGAKIDKYAVQWATSANGSWTTLPAQITTTTFTTSAFSCCQKYYLRILAHNAAGWSPASTVVGWIPAVPTAPQYPWTSPGDKWVYVSWTAPASNGGANVEAYEVQQATGLAGPWKTISLASSQHAYASGLTNGTTYFFRVRASNATGFGPYTSVVAATPSIVPSTPMGPSAAVAGSQVTLTWSTPQYDGGSPIQQYNIYATLNPNGPWTHIASTLGPALKYVVNDAAPGKTYYFRIAAQNQFGEGPVASTSAVIPPTVPGKVTVCTSTLPGGWGSGIIRVTWDPPISDGGEPILFYEVHVRLTNDPSVYTTTYVWSPSTTVDVDRLDDSYNEVFITPYNKIGSGPPCFIGLT